jgi:hypothetical protein
LHSSFEQQNPFPDHELLANLAQNSGGQMLKDQDAVVALLASLPVERGPSRLVRVPIWSCWWAMTFLLSLITAEWCYRRRIGLA